jgi:2-dehydro-3-deoxygluconokinase
MSKIIGYGELMLRLTPISENSDKKNIVNYSSTFAGCEANSLIFLARREHDCEFLSAFPKNDLGLMAESYLTSNNLKCNLKYDDNRLGTFFTEPGTNSNSFTKILYDRKNSSFSKYNLSEEQINTLIKGSSFLIISGITPSLSKICYENIFRLIEIARSNNIKIVYDVNYRKDLWSIEECRNFNLKILSEVDYLFTSSGSIRKILDFNENQKTESFFSDTESSVKYLYEKFNIEFIGMTVRNKKSLSGFIFNDKKFYRGEIYELDQIDRVGAGDSFLGACLHGIINKWNMNKIVSFATSTFASSHTISGDLNYLDDEEIDNFKRKNSN